MAERRRGHGWLRTYLSAHQRRRRHATPEELPAEFSSASVVVDVETRATSETVEPNLATQKEVEYYAATVTAWYDTRLERDKSLLTLSSGGIGVLLALISAFGIHSRASLWLYIAALGAFVVCIAAVVGIFQRNSSHLEHVLREGEDNDRWLAVLDRAAVGSFLCAVLCSLSIGITGAVHSLHDQERKLMADNEKGKTMAQDSFNKALRVRPEKPGVLQKSYNGAVNIKPERPSSAQSTQTPPVSTSKPQVPQQSQQPAKPKSK